MKDFIYVFAVLAAGISLVSCTEKEEYDWAHDVLSLSVSAGTESTVSEAGDGNWSIVAGPSCQETFTVDVRTDASWSVEIDYITADDEEWISVTEDGSSFNIRLTDNAGSANRLAAVEVSTGGNISVSKKITVMQGNAGDVLATEFSENLPEGVSVTEDTDGTVELLIPETYFGTFDFLSVISSQEYGITLSFDGSAEQDWVSVSDREGILTLEVKKNENNLERSAVLEIKAVSGTLVVTETYRLIQHSVVILEWAGDFLQMTEIILSSDSQEGVLVGKYDNVSEIVFSNTPEWLNFTFSEGEIHASVTANTSTNLERTAYVTMSDRATGTASPEILFRQGMQGYGVILNKSLWSLIYWGDWGTGSGQDSSANVYSYFKLFNNHWPADKAESEASYTGPEGVSSKSSFIEIGTGTEETPVMFVFDMGESCRQYDSFGLMPRLQWTGNSPTNAKVEVSNDNDTWSELYSGEAFTKEMVTIDGSQNDCYGGIIKWLDLGDLRSERYVKLSMWESLGGTICLDEVFVSDRSLLDK